MFKRILVANRGEIAVRIVRTCRDMGIEAVALYEGPDRGSLHVRLADRCAELESERGYMDKQAILDLALRTGAEAIHPGYGFLAERPDFISDCDRAGIVFIGPPAEAVARTQCKADAVAAARAAGFATPATSERTYGSGVPSELREEAERLGYPLIIKSCVGGRGRGSHRALAAEELEEAVRWAQAEAQAVYGDTQIYLEKAALPGHSLAVQVLGDNHGNLVHMGEREGSIQLGNQKIIEESPAPCLRTADRSQICGTALDIARLFGIRNAATVEFLVDGEGRPFFTEIKPRIMTDHPVTEMVAPRVDLVREQIRLAAGEPLGLRQQDLGLRGHAMQCVITAEDPRNGFMPSPGYLRRVRLPGGPNVRVDTYVYSGCAVPVKYDPILAKVIVWGVDRAECLQRMRRSLQDFIAIGIPTNLPYLQGVLEHPAVVQGCYDTSLLDRPMPESGQDAAYLRDVAVAAAVAFARRDLLAQPGAPPEAASGWHRASRRLPE
jgi:acetyl/propionyl-CoA carboxylase alpha subunit